MLAVCNQVVTPRTVVLLNTNSGCSSKNVEMGSNSCCCMMHATAGGCQWLVDSEGRAVTAEWPRFAYQWDSQALQCWILEQASESYLAKHRAISE